MILKEEFPRSVGAQYATGDQWRNNSRKNQGMEPKQKQYPVVDVTGDRNKIRCCKEQYCIGTWNVDVYSCHLLFDHFQFALIHGPDIPDSYAVLLFTALDLASITSHIHNWVLFLLWLHPFILSEVISPLPALYKCINKV